MTDMVLDRLVGCLQAALQYPSGAQVAPVSLLWPDEGRHWESVISRIGERIPVVTLGDYAPEANCGPAYWIRCVVAGTVDTQLPAGTPVVYLPGVSRSALRAADSTPPHLAPIAELQYRGQWFSHPNGRDWTPRGLLSHSERGLGLQIIDNAETVSALHLALGSVLDEPMDRLGRLVLNAAFFHDLVSPDAVRSLLFWLDDPTRFRTRSDAAHWEAFVGQCRSDFGFDPTLDGEITAARKLGEREGKWGGVWRRFAETPGRYPGIPKKLRQARPSEQLTLGQQAHSESWPQDNEAAEKDLQEALKRVGALTPEVARARLTELDGDHAWRRGTVWADLELAPLAFAVEHLAALAEFTAQPLASSTLAQLVEDYVARGWRADDAALRAIAAVRAGIDREVVGSAVASIYRPWLDAGARSLQAIVGPMANAHTYRAGPSAEATPGTAAVFVDGLRFDIALRVQKRLATAGLAISSSTGLAALPTVTQTAKPALIPVQGGALTAGPDLHAANSATRTKASTAVLRSLMGDHGVQVLGTSQTGDPAGIAWVEVGELDHHGHDAGIGLVDHLDDDVGRVVRRVRQLIDAGWQRVEVVTDHGWILMPTGLEKVELPPATAEIKKGRCARLKEGAVVDAPTVPWFWDPNVRIAIAPGITCFEAGKEYEHGGVSPQECIVPRLTVTVGASAAAGPAIVSVKWLGLLCRIELEGAGAGVKADLRALPADPKTSIAEEAKETVESGRVSLVVLDEDHEGERAHLVLVAPNGQILAQREVIVGRNR